MGRIQLKNEEQFKKDLLTFIDELENQEIFDKSLYSLLIEYGINKIGLGESEFKACGDWIAQGSIYEAGKSKSDLRRSTVFSR